MINKFGKALITMFGIGYFKYAPGTLASFVTCIIYYLLLINDLIGSIFYYLILFLFLITIYSIISIDNLTSQFKKKDAKEIVIDEFVGQSIPLLFLSFVGLGFFLSLPNWIMQHYHEIMIFLCFLLFRFFDILKPFPINIVDQKMKNGLGVILDDILAGIYATISLIIIILIF